MFDKMKHKDGRVIDELKRGVDVWSDIDPAVALLADHSLIPGDLVDYGARACGMAIVMTKAHPGRTVHAVDAFIKGRYPDLKFRPHADFNTCSGEPCPVPSFEEARATCAPYRDLKVRMQDEFWRNLPENISAVYLNAPSFEGTILAEKLYDHMKDGGVLFVDAFDFNRYFQDVLPAVEFMLNRKIPFVRLSKNLLGVIKGGSVDNAYRYSDNEDLETEYLLAEKLGVRAVANSFPSMGWTAGHRIFERNRHTVLPLWIAAKGDGCRILETGTWCGGAAYTILRQYPNIQWDYCDPQPQLSVEIVHETFGHRYRRAGRTIDDVTEGYYDIAFIDGDHSYEAVRKDTRMILPLMKPGGVIVWHDYLDSFNICPEVSIGLRDFPIRKTAVVGTMEAYSIVTRP